MEKFRRCKIVNTNELSCRSLGFQSTWMTLHVYDDEDFVPMDANEWRENYFSLTEFVCVCVCERHYTSVAHYSIHLVYGGCGSRKSIAGGGKLAQIKSLRLLCIIARATFRSNKHSTQVTKMALLSCASLCKRWHV